MNVENFLVKHCLSDYIEVFREQKIDLNILISLDDSELKELVPFVGDRKRLRLAIQEIHLSSSEPPLKKILLQDYTLLETFDDLERDIVQDSELASNIESESVFGSESLSEKTSNLESDSALGSESVQEENLNFESELTSTSDTATDLLAETVMKDNEILNFNLLKLIESHIIGRAMILKYKENHVLDNKNRNFLCDIIVSHFLNAGIRLNNFSIRVLAEKIVELFPTELKAMCFVSPVSKRNSRQNRPEIARGKLIDKHRNKLSKLRKNLNLGKLKDNEQHLTPTGAESSPQALESQIWLKHNHDPMDEVKSHWDLSYPLRKNGIIPEDWPILRTQMAVELISVDFLNKYPHCREINISEKFENVFNNIYEIRRNLLKPSDESLLTLLRDEITTDSKNAIRLYLLTSLVPPRGRAILAKKKQWKLSLSEARDGLFLQVKTVGDIEKAKKDKTDYMYKRGLTVQPYLLLVGPTLGNIHCAYVVINNKEFKIRCVADSILYCFQSYFILDFKYPVECEHIWYIMQWKLFGIQNKSDPKIPYITDLLK